MEITARKGFSDHPGVSLKKSDKDEKDLNEKVYTASP
jgi:hypothetical protein